jgi:three-Cys-motif partner protein
MIQFNPHEIIPSPYKGREQAFIKHMLLERYLERLLRIVGWSAAQLGYREIVFVDCFAGPWQDDSEDLSSTSIGISISLLSEVHKDLVARDKAVHFRAIYVERDTKAFSRLQRFLSLNSPMNVSTEAVHGDFMDKIDEILQNCPNDTFTFFFIDPKGYLTIKPTVLDKLLRRPGSEFLINFMYSFVNRTVSIAAMKGEVAELLGQNFNTKHLPVDPPGREQYLLQLYRSTITERASNGKGNAMSGYVAILDPIIDRTKYHLIYLTRHPLGIIEFMTVSEALDSIQAKVRSAAKLNKKTASIGTVDMFGIDADQPAVSRQADILRLEEYWLTLIGERPLTVDMHLFAHALCQTMCYPSELQAALKNLIDQGKVVNLDADVSKRRKKWVDFEKKERLKRV